jgi:hypothetical protein
MGRDFPEAGDGDISASIFLSRKRNLCHTPSLAIQCFPILVRAARHLEFSEEDNGLETCDLRPHPKPLNRGLSVAGIAAPEGPHGKTGSPGNGAAAP